jgi:four helix bundle protein
MRSRPMEEMIAWQVAREVTTEVYRRTRAKPFDGDPALRSELRRAARSIMANIALGCERPSAREFIRCLERASGSTTELRSLIAVTVDIGLLERRAAFGMLVRVAEVARLIAGWHTLVQLRQRRPVQRGSDRIN